MRRRALVVGCNYPGSAHQLNGCANDASNITSLLVEVFDYKPQDILLMVDTDAQTATPTGANIKVCRYATWSLRLQKPSLTVLISASARFSGPCSCCAGRA